MTDCIRLAHCGDMAGLGLLWHDAVHKGAVGAYDAAQLQAWSPAPKSPAFMTERLSGQIILVAEDDEGLAGFFTLTPEGELDMAYVRPDRKGDGLAARLLAAIQTRRVGATLQPSPFRPAISRGSSLKNTAGRWCRPRPCAPTESKCRTTAWFCILKQASGKHQPAPRPGCEQTRRPRTPPPETRPDKRKGLRDTR